MEISFILRARRVWGPRYLLKFRGSHPADWRSIILRAIIVDDEQLSIKRLKRILSESGEFSAFNTFINPLEAYEFVKNNAIDVAFLDISMPEINGMKLSGLLHELDASIDLIFVTGYDDYAVQAFDMNALDYLLKPVTAQRLAKTIDKIRKSRGNSTVQPPLVIQLFNGLKISLRGQTPEQIKLRSPKTEELLAFLLYKGTVSREEIIDTLWSELEPEKAWKNLNSTLYYIRKAFSDSKLGGFLQTGKSEIRIDESSMYCDLYEFEKLTRQIRTSPGNSAELFEQAVMLYEGTFLKGKAYEWASEQTRSLEQKYLQLLEGAARHHLQTNEQQKSLHYFSEILKLDGLREDICHEVIRLYLGLGRKNEALRQYRLLEEALQKDLGTKPDPQISGLIERVSQ
ncbi:response regulator [Paenibacillaceae bacterium]|nr:response regulator [Paenibacillaceae bacterium]